MVNEEPSRIRRREIVEADLGGVTDLLVRGFPARPRAYWQRGLRRMGERPALAGCPRYGFLLEAGARPVGVALMLFDAPGEDVFEPGTGSDAALPAGASGPSAR